MIPPGDVYAFAIYTPFVCLDIYLFTQEADAMSKTRNPVARHSRTYNKAHVMTDRKKAAKRGYRKHKGHARQQD